MTTPDPLEENPSFWCDHCRSYHPVTTPCIASDTLEAIKQAVIDDLKPMAARVQKLIDAAVAKALERQKDCMMMAIGAESAILPNVGDRLMRRMDAIRLKPKEPDEVGL